MSPDSSGPSGSPDGPSHVDRSLWNKQGDAITLEHYIQSVPESESLTN